MERVKGIEPSYSAGSPRVFTRVGGWRPWRALRGRSGPFLRGNDPSPSAAVLNGGSQTSASTAHDAAPQTRAQPCGQRLHRGGATVPARRHACPGPRGPGRHAYRHIAQNWAAGGFDSTAHSHVERHSIVHRSLQVNCAKGYRIRDASLPGCGPGDSSSRGPPHKTTVYCTFVRLARQLGFRGPPGTPGPRLHDLRHTDLFSPEECSNYLRNSGYASI